MESLIEFWNGLPWFIKWPAWFWFQVIFIRGIIAKDIMSWMEEKGILKDGVIRPIGRFIKRLVINSEQDLIYYQHRLGHELKKGHQPLHINQCNDGLCATLKKAPSSVASENTSRSA